MRKWFGARTRIDEDVDDWLAVSATGLGNGKFHRRHVGGKEELSSD
jgi:hypothetical protein